MGEARLLNGDGIFGPDPVRALLLDDQGRLLARSQKSLHFHQSCATDGDCMISDVSRFRILIPDLATFRLGPPVPGLADQERDQLWDLEDGTEAWGFTARDATIGEAWWIVGIVVWSWKISLLVHTLIGILLATSMRQSISLARIRQERSERRGIAVAVSGLATGLVMIFAFMAAYVSLLSGLSPLFWLPALAFGFVLSRLVATARAIARRRRPAAIGG